MCYKSNKEFSFGISYYITLTTEAVANNRLKLPRIDQFTISGPPKVNNQILDDPNALWIEDKWNNKKYLNAMKVVKDQEIGVNKFWKNKYEKEAQKYWHMFYRRNKDNFYKDRHYLQAVFPELDSTCNSYQQVTLLEVGCGVGNAVLPLLEINPYLQVVAVDFASSAIEILKSSNQYHQFSDRITASLYDVTCDRPPISRNLADLALCMFVLSAIPPEKHVQALKNIANSLKVEGKLLVRDYGRYDEAQLRFKSNSKLSDAQYVRQDGTLTYYFTTDDIKQLCESYYDFDGCILKILENKYITRQYANRHQRRARHRVWLHAKIQKISAS